LLLTDCFLSLFLITLLPNAAVSCVALQFCKFDVVRLGLCFVFLPWLVMCWLLFIEEGSSFLVVVVPALVHLLLGGLVHLLLGEAFFARVFFSGW
jgi:hypothetical protein